MVDDSRVTLERVITTVELGRRTSSRPNYEIESRAVAELMAAMANQPNADSILQKLVDRERSGPSVSPPQARDSDIQQWSG